MRFFTSVIIVVLFSISNCFGQNKVVWFKNNTGIIEDVNGSVTLWENQIDGFGNAVQTDSTLGGEQMQETYPGKVNVGFVKEGSFLEVENSNASVSDNSFSVFYVGKVADVKSVAALFGNFRVDNNNWSTCSGVRFTRKSNGDMTIQYGKPGYQQIVLNNLPENEFFFFGFSVDTAGNYMYFDNSSILIKTGKLNGTIYQNSDNIFLNLARQADGNYTYDQTEVAELLMYDDKLSETDFKNELTRLSQDYKEIVKAEFMVTNVLPETRTNLLVTDPISLSFSQSVDINSELPKVYINRSTRETTGNWYLTTANTLTFTPAENWPYNGFVTVEINENLKSTENVLIDVSKTAKYNFLVATDTNFGPAEIIKFDAIATVDFPQEGHKLPLNLTLPTHRTEKIPVHIWVHGGGWSGGTAATSIASNSPHGEYLAENLGIATLGISYRCHGSNGNFTLAMKDIDTAYKWALENAETYNFDMTKVFFSGGSAGTPLASLASQRYNAVIGFIGFNGMYDFVNDQNSFGQWNGYGQETPSAEANSAIFQLRENPPVTILMHGDADTTIPYTQSTLFADKINENGGKARAVIYPDEVHAFFNLNQPAYEDVLIEMVNFINEVLKEEASLSIEEKKSEDEIVMYPNPVKKGNMLKIQLYNEFNGEKVSVEILNVLGQSITKKIVYPSLNTISISTKSLIKGTYFIKTSVKTNLKTLKFIIQ